VLMNFSALQVDQARGAKPRVTLSCVVCGTSLSCRFVPGGVLRSDYNLI
jgi:hypothetical protein